MNKYSHEQYINKLNRLNTTMRPLEDYVGYHNKILHRCNKCGNEEYLAPIQFIYKSVYKCIKCNLYHHTSYKLTQDLYIEKLKLFNINITPLEIYITGDTKIKHKCNICGYEFYDKPTYIFSKKWKCSSCYPHGKEIIIGKNDLWTLYPNIAKQLKNKEDGYKVSIDSGKKFEFICECCGSSFFRFIRNAIKGSGIPNKHIYCTKCRRNVSYGERFLISLLNQLNIEYKHDISLVWSNNKRYDFYIDFLSMCIEVHGLQHFKEMPKDSYWIDLESQINNDKYKKQLALDNGIIHYIEIDASESNKEYLVSSIINSKLNTLFDLNNIDFDKCSYYALGSELEEILSLWNSGIRSTVEISKVVKLKSDTVAKYLKEAAAIELCDYNPKYEMIKHVYDTPGISVTCINTGEVFKTMSEAARKHNTRLSYIKKSCENPNIRHAGIYNGERLSWKYTDPNYVPIKVDTKGRPILQYDMNNNFVAEYKSMRDAMKQTGIAKSGIADTANGKNTHAGGFLWRFK